MEQNHGLVECAWEDIAGVLEGIAAVWEDLGGAAGLVKTVLKGISVSYIVPESKSGLEFACRFRFTFLIN